jgi:hypothetical protein
MCFWSHAIICEVGKQDISNSDEIQGYLYHSHLQAISLCSSAQIREIHLM